MCTGSTFPRVAPTFLFFSFSSAFKEKKSIRKGKEKYKKSEEKDKKSEEKYKKSKYRKTYLAHVAARTKSD